MAGCGLLTVPRVRDITISYQGKTGEARRLSTAIRMRSERGQGGAKMQKRDLLLGMLLMGMLCARVALGAEALTKDEKAIRALNQRFHDAFKGLPE